MRIEQVVVGVPKPQSYRNEKLRAICNQLPCTWPPPHDCKETVGWCHPNLQRFGKGRGLKSSDAAVFAGCWTANYEADQSPKYSYEEKERFTYEAMAVTHVLMIEGGHLVPKA